ILSLRQIGYSDKVFGFEIGDDEGIALSKNLLGLGDNVAVGRNDGLDELEGIADEAPCLVGLLDDQARALNAFVEDRLLGVGERQRLIIALAEVDDGHRRFRLDPWHWFGRSGRRACTRGCGLLGLLGRSRRLRSWRGGRRCSGRSLLRTGESRVQQDHGENTESRKSKAHGAATPTTD